jgi:hypothetical protein
MSTPSAKITHGTQSPNPSSYDDAVSIGFNVQDLNGNAMPMGTTIEVTANASAGTLEDPTAFTIPCDGSIGGFSFTSHLVRPAAGASLVGAAITVVVTSPKGIITRHRVDIL